MLAPNVSLDLVKNLEGGAFAIFGEQTYNEDLIGPATKILKPLSVR
jgi:hypothetical protein